MPSLKELDRQCINTHVELRCSLHAPLPFRGRATDSQHFLRERRGPSIETHIRTDVGEQNTQISPLAPGMRSETVSPQFVKQNGTQSGQLSSPEAIRRFARATCRRNRICPPVTKTPALSLPEVGALSGSAPRPNALPCAIDRPRRRWPTRLPRSYNHHLHRACEGARICPSRCSSPGLWWARRR